MAMATLKYRTQHAQADETKQGAPVFDGAPAGFHQWEFRTTLRAGSRKTRSTDSSAAAKKKGDDDEEDEVKDEPKSSNPPATFSQSFPACGLESASKDKETPAAAIYWLHFAVTSTRGCCLIK